MSLEHATSWGCRSLLTYMMDMNQIHGLIERLIYMISSTCQIQASLAPPSADYHWNWNECRKNYARCSQPQLQYLQGD